MKVHDVMTKTAVCTPPDASIQQAAERMKNLDVGALPVCEDDRLVGMITDRDIAIRSASEGHNPRMEHVRDVMTPELIYCFEDQDTDEAARLMRDKQIRRLPVLNRDQRLVGMISLGDLAKEPRDRETTGNTMAAIVDAPPTR
jgi:CBS domain-containing protein